MLINCAGLAKRYNVSVADLVLKARAGADFNNSSLAVRRSALEVSAHLLREPQSASTALHLPVH